MKRWVHAAVFVLFAGTTLFAQSATELEQRYGANKLYMVGSTILFRPRFDKSGQICLAELVPNPNPRDKEGFSGPNRFGYFYADSDRLFPSMLLNSGDIVAAFDQLAPREMRKGSGKAFKDIDGFGASYAVVYRYENIEFSMTVFRTHKLSFKLDDRTFDTTFGSPDGDPIRAYVQWTDRTCSDVY